MALITPMEIMLSRAPSSLSYSASLAALHPKLSSLSLDGPPRRISTVIRMGGGPRTYPGGVSKWQWKRMQAKKQKQLLKARLSRERQIYEMRKRAELKAAVAELERPWEPVEKPPNLFSVAADEQLKVLADRFQRPGGFDLWTERDGPQLFETVEGLPSARFFPKGVVHSVKPYGKIAGSDEWDSNEIPGKRNNGNSPVEANSEYRRDRRQRGGRLRNQGTRTRLEAGQVGFDAERKVMSSSRGVGGDDRSRKSYKSENKLRSGRSRVYDMSLQQDGSFEFGD